jgi:hypothetical protein
MPKLGQKHANRYPWDEWFIAAREKPLKLVKDKHYAGTDASMDSQIRKTAAVRGLRVTSSIGVGCVTFSVLRRKRK